MPELMADGRNLRQEIFNLRLQQASAQLEKPARLHTLRRDIARLETRMGKGKGPLESWVAVIRPANILFEVDGVTEAVARESLRLAATKLPIKTKFISRHRRAS